MSKEKLFYSALSQIAELEEHVTNPRLREIARSLGLSKTEIEELKELYKKMHKMLYEGAGDQVTPEEKLKIIEEILYPSGEIKEERVATNLEKAMKHVDCLDTYSLSLRSIKRRISLRNSLNGQEERELEDFIRKTLEEREKEKIDIDLLCEEVISEYTKSPHNICSFIENKALISEVDPKELKELLIKKLINLKQET